jgi:xanthine dehydrogenase molybdenum-binding subunit
VAALTWKSGVANKPGSVDQSGATVRVNFDATVDVLTAACDLGTGAATTIAQIAADALGVPLGSVRIPPVDTAMTAYDSGAFASRTLYRAGKAVHDAAVVVRAQVLAHAGGMLEAEAADLDLSDGVVSVRGAPAKSLPVVDVLRDAMYAGCAFIGSAQAPQTTAPTAAVHFAVVDVDPESGQVHVRRLVAVQDVGRAVNPGIVEGQIAGAAYQGLGYALTEDLVVDRTTGEVLTGTFMDYRLPTVADGPRVEAHMLEFPDPDGPFGAKGAGEASIILPAPAVANAVLDAVGVSMTELPITAERVWQALALR